MTKLQSILQLISKRQKIHRKIKDRQHKMPQKSLTASQKRKDLIPCQSLVNFTKPFYVTYANKVKSYRCLSSS